ncbi:MFS transporter [Streptomyces sp. LP11]|uniref:MFS transporter n=1 Tax=Streptomyces pyxinicus TaxID=2970331 RepID=A0ABT2BA30_9ACTN|nr:MFS transporter [Streptomyces sp. LP11]MCS0605369.1 MFS transporter [Streptomyces sp. LP11]
MEASDVPLRTGGQSPPAEPARPEAGSRRDTAVLWCTNALDGLGSQASGLVLPLLLLDLGHGPGTAGGFAGVCALAGVLLGPLVAVPADRGHRRALMTGTAVPAALAMAGLALACLGPGRPPLWLLLGLALVERLCSTAYEAAARGTLSRLASEHDLPRAVAGLQAGDHAALVLGPALGGALFGIARFLPFAADAVTYAVTALGTRAIRTPLDTPEGPPPRAFTGDLRSGLAVVLRSPVLRLVLCWSSVASGVLGLLFYTAVFVLGGDSGSTVTGGVLAASGGAGLAGSLVAARVVRRLGAHRALTAATWLLLPPCAALAVAEGPWVWALCFSVMCALLPVVTVVLGTAAVLAAPREAQARAGAVLAAGSAVSAAAAPLCAALLVDRGGGRAAALGAGAVLAVLALHTRLRARAVLRPAGSGGRP